jgi:flavin-dependent dehydrogenase
VFFIGDAARVVEPFTGEGIYYALASGELAARFIPRRIERKNDAAVMPQFIREHRALYRGRLWINRLARAAVLSPRVASAFVPLARNQPSLLRLLTAKVVR